MPFGQLVIGSPGSGKTTYCNGLQQFLTALRRPNAHIVNLDFANTKLPYQASIDVNSLISVKDVMQELGLGPNGAMLYCVEYLEQNLDWLLHKIRKLGKEAYLVFDLPGQVELSTNHASLTKIVQRLEKETEIRLVAVHLVDATHILDPSRYVSLLLLSLRAMLHLELPHINVLSKVDLLGPASGGTLPFPLEFYTDPNPDELRQYLEDHNTTMGRRRYETLNQKITEIIEDFSLVGFETLAVEDKESMWRLVRTIDKVGGWVFVHAGQTDNSEDDDDEEEEMPHDLRKALDAQAYLENQGPSASAASALSLFTTLDGNLPGWGTASDVQERYVDPFAPGGSALEPQTSSDNQTGSAQLEAEFARQEEQRIYAAWREWKEEEKAKAEAAKSAPQEPLRQKGETLRIQGNWNRQ